MNSVKTGAVKVILHFWVETNFCLYLPYLLSSCVEFGVRDLAIENFKAFLRVETGRTMVLRQAQIKFMSVP